MERKKDWEKEQAKEIAKGKTPRPDWSAAKNSLRSFFDNHPLATGQHIVEIPETSGGHQLIELLDTI